VSFVGRMIGTVLRPLAERQAKGRSLDELAEALERSGATLTVRFGRAADTPRNREALNHIVGIERWGQRRLRVPLGEPLLMDSYRGYRLPDSTSMDNLVQAFADTRRDTVNLARGLGSADLKPPAKVRHNDLGELSMGAWLAYLDGHAKRESLRVRSQRV
jgi:hypothetical protein